MKYLPCFMEIKSNGDFFITVFRHVFCNILLPTNFDIIATRGKQMNSLINQLSGIAT